MACLLVLLTLSLLTPPGTRQKPRSALPFRAFSAEMITASPILSPVQMAIYRDRNWVRVDLPQGGYQIYDLKLHHADWIRPNGFCSPAPFHPPPGILPFLWRGRVIPRKLGVARLRGHLVRIEQITVYLRHGGKQVFTAWLAEDLDSFPLRVQFVSAHGPLEINYRDIRLGALPKPWLRLPAACHAVR